jgi:sugar phosphate isomerase/epimerase
MKLTVLTLGCPNWDLPTVLERCRGYGFAGIDFRGLGDQLDITRLPAFTTGIEETRGMIADAGMEVSGISSSINVCDPEKLKDNLEEARRTIPVALGLGAKNIRVFGGGPVDKVGHQHAAAAGSVCVEAILDLDNASKLHWNFETHDHWVRAADCRHLLDAVSNPAFGTLWDLGHTSRVGNESPEQTLAALGRRVHYTHIKDAAFDPKHPQAMGDGWRYTLPGAGELPLAHGLKLLRDHGYTGWLAFEHEKRWHAELPEPEIAFPAFVKWVREILG